MIDMVFSKEERSFFKEFAFGHSYIEIKEEFERRFEREISINQVRYCLKQNGVKTGKDTRFKKGHTPVNKGQKVSPEHYARSYPTMFKKGGLPPTVKPIGTEHLSKDGYITVKVDNGKRWRFKHVLVWEEHYGKIPKNHCLIFLDGNRSNCDISNLRCISRQILLIMNRNKMFKDDPKLNETMLNIAEYMRVAGIATLNTSDKTEQMRIERAIKKRKKEGENG